MSEAPAGNGRGLRASNGPRNQDTLKEDDTLLTEEIPLHQPVAGRVVWYLSDIHDRDVRDVFADTRLVGNVTAVRITMIVIVTITSLLLILTVLMHKGRGGGLSDMFGGGISSTAGSSGVAEKNLNRITVGVLCVWTVAIIAYGLMIRFYF